MGFDCMLNPLKLLTVLLHESFSGVNVYDNDSVVLISSFYKAVHDAECLKNPSLSRGSIRIDEHVL